VFSLVGVSDVVEWLLQGRPSLSLRYLLVLRHDLFHSSSGEAKCQIQHRQKFAARKSLLLQRPPLGPRLWDHFQLKMVIHPCWLRVVCNGNLDGLYRFDFVPVESGFSSFEIPLPLVYVIALPEQVVRE
jgi:hypothetical protein